MNMKSRMVKKNLHGLSFLAVSNNVRMGVSGPCLLIESTDSMIESTSPILYGVH